MEKIISFFPRKYQLLLLCNETPIPKTKLAAFLAVVLLSLFPVTLKSASADSQILINLEVVANGQTVLTRNSLAVPDSCTVTDTDGQTHSLSNYKVICALNSATQNYSVADDPNYGLFLESLLGYSGPLESCTPPDCWTFLVNGSFANRGVGNYSLSSDDSVLFTFGNNAQPTLAPSPEPTSTPIPTHTPTPLPATLIPTLSPTPTPTSTLPTPSPQVLATNEFQTSQPTPAPTKAVLSKTEVINKALAYLRSQQDKNGLIEIIGVSDWAAMSFAAAGEPNERLNKQSLRYAKTVVDNISVEKATDVEREVLTLTAIGKGPGNLTTKLKSFANNSQIGDPNFINDDIFGILAFIAAGQESDIVLTNAVTFVLSNQNSDGGWGFQVGAASDIDTTSAAIQALVAAQNSGFNIPTNSLDQAREFLKKNQNSDGGFPFSKNINISNGSSSSWAIQALRALGENTSRAEAYLTSLQENSGGFKVDTRSDVSSLTTAYAVTALSGKVWPVRQTTAVLAASIQTQNLPSTGFDLTFPVALSLIFSLMGYFLLRATNGLQFRKSYHHNYADFYTRIHHQTRR